MAEPAVIVLLLSPLEDLFLDGDGSPERCAKSYRNLTAKGMRILFISELSPDEVRRRIEGLTPPPPVLCENGKLHLPADAPFVRDFAVEQPCSASVEAIFEHVRSRGDILIPVGVGRLPDHSFLRLTSLAALTPGSAGPPAELPAYRCTEDGPAAWNEWAEQMTRRIRIILRTSEMPHRRRAESGTEQ